MTNDALKVMIIAGGLAHEREVSLRSGRRVGTALKNCGHDVRIIDLAPGFFEELRSFKPDVVWPLVHGVEGEGGSLQDLLSLNDTQFVGTSAEGCRISISKPVAKSVVDKNFLKTPDFVALPQQVFQMLGAEAILESLTSHFEFPMMVKPSVGGSSLGVSKVCDAHELRHAMIDAFAYCNEVMVERFIDGREVAASIIDDAEGNARVLPLVEIQTDRGAYDYDARYNSGRSVFFCPPDIDDEDAQTCIDLALSCHRVLELRDVSRIDMILDKDGQAWFIDANVMPGMTDTSLLPLAASKDKGFEEVIDLITRRAASS